jgi:hypothetical protein
MDVKTPRYTETPPANQSINTTIHRRRVRPIRDRSKVSTPDPANVSETQESSPAEAAHVAVDAPTLRRFEEMREIVGIVLLLQRAAPLLPVRPETPIHIPAYEQERQRVLTEYTVEMAKQKTFEEEVEEPVQTVLQPRPKVQIRETLG